ncbi:MAG: hypothetical protein Q9227_003761 [Pyrenula ochraceoflavens]
MFQQETIPVPSIDTMSGDIRAKSPSVSSVATPYDNVEEGDLLSETRERRLLETKLLHHFVTEVIYTFPAVEEPKVKHTWMVDVFELGLRFDFLHNTILAISALHLAAMTDSGDTDVRFRDSYQQPDTSFRTSGVPVNTLCKAHRVYLNLAIRQQRAALANINPDNACAICFCGSLIAMQSFRLLPDSTQQLDDYHWIRLLHSLSGIINLARPMLADDAPYNNIIHSKPDFSRAFTHIFHEKNAGPFHPILDFPGHPEDPDQDDESIRSYNAVVGAIGYIYERILEQEPDSWNGRRLVSFGMMSPSRFVQNVAESRPRALVIIAHFFAMNTMIKHFWCSHESAVREIKRLAMLVPREWQWAMVWPLKMAQKCEAGFQQRQRELSHGPPQSFSMMIPDIRERFPLSSQSDEMSAERYT